MNISDRIVFTFSKQCNMNCPFCYGYFNKEEVDLKQCKIITKKCAEMGIKRITFGGGDPLMYSYIGELVDYAKKLRMEVAVDTNGINYKNIDLNWINKIEYLSLPLDGYNASIHDYTRNYRGHYEKVLCIIKEFGKLVDIRINTVVVSSNYQYLYKLYQLLQQLEIKTWHIYEFLPKERGGRNYEKCYIEYEQYSDIIEKILNEKSNMRINHVRAKKRIMNNSNQLYVSSNGILYLNKMDDIHRYFVVGNILTENNEYSCNSKIASIE